jgi:hypothetical protein
MPILQGVGAILALLPAQPKLYVTGPRARPAGA